MSNKQKRKSRATIHDMDQEHKVGKCARVSGSIGKQLTVTLNSFK